MKCPQILSISGLGALMLFVSGCSGNKTAEHSAVISSDAGKGTAASSAAAKQVNTALVRFVNGTPTAKDMAFGSNTPFPRVGSFDVTDYRALPAERHDFKLLIDSKADEAMATDSEGLTAGKHYTVLALPGVDGKFTINSISDDLTPPATGKAKVRILNMAPNAASVTLYFGGAKDPLISNVGLNQPTDYKEVAPSAGSLSLMNTLNKRNSEVVKDVQLEAGKLYTILIFGDTGGKLKVKTIQDLFTDAPNGSTM